MDTDTVAVVFTAKSKDKIFEHGGSQSWVIGKNAVDAIKYVVCTRNTDPQDDDDKGERPESRNAAFLVGKVSGMEFVTHRNGRDRYRILFSDYAIIDMEDFRAGSHRNPVTYSDVAQCRDVKDLDIEALDWTPMPPRGSGDGGGSEPPKSPSPIAGLTIAQAKEGLAAYFGVPIANIQITISG